MKSFTVSRRTFLAIYIPIAVLAVYGFIGETLSMFGIEGQIAFSEVPFRIHAVPFAFMVFLLAFGVVKVKNKNATQ